MNINFELYRIFYTVANNGNITKASNELNISQPAISKSIKNLEEQLGGKLFVRTKRGVILTEEGKEFYRYIKQAMEYIANAENKFTELVNLETGCIKIGISSTLTKQFLLPYLEEFYRLYPKIDIVIVTDVTSELIRKLRFGLIDIIILNLNNDNFGNDVEIIKCKKINDCFVVGKKYKSLAEKIISIKDLINYPLILQTKESNTRQFIDEIAEKNGVLFKPNMELASYSLVIDFTKIGFGIGYATKEYISNELKNEELFELRLKEKIPSRHIGIMFLKNGALSFSSKKLIEMITKWNNESK